MTGEWLRRKLSGLKMVDDQHGYILGLVMIFFIIFTIMGLAFVKMGSFESLHALNHYQRVKAYYHAESGIHKGLWLLNDVSAAAATFSNDTVSAVYDSVNFILTSTGTVGNVNKTIKVTLSVTPSIQVLNWEEL